MLPNPGLASLLLLGLSAEQGPSLQKPAYRVQLSSWMKAAHFWMSRQAIGRSVIQQSDYPRDSACADAVSWRTGQVEVSLLVSPLLCACKQLLKVLAQALGQVWLGSHCLLLSFPCLPLSIVSRCLSQSRSGWSGFLSLQVTARHMVPSPLGAESSRICASGVER